LSHTQTQFTHEFNGITLNVNAHQVAGNVEVSVDKTAGVQSLVPLLAHVLLQRCTVFEYFLTVKASQTVHTSSTKHTNH